VSTSDPTPEQWLIAEDQGCLQQRSARLAWLLTVTPPAHIWLFPGGWLGQQLFEESRYSFIYGQFVASAVLGFAFVERTLAAMHYGAGRNDLQRATKQVRKIILTGHVSTKSGWTGRRTFAMRPCSISCANVR
jgi:hypothetical protein